MPKFRPARSKRFALWDSWGFTPQEAAEFSKVYSVANMRSLPYLIKMARTRRLYTTNLAGKGYGQDEIRRSVGMLYEAKGWLDANGDPSPWLMLKSFRRQIISSGGDPSPGFAPTRRSHHSRAEITQAELNAQAKAQAKNAKIRAEIDKQIW